MDFKETSKFKAEPAVGRTDGWTDGQEDWWREREGTKKKNQPDDEVWRCGVTLNQQLMSEQPKPRLPSSNNPRAAVPS